MIVCLYWIRERLVHSLVLKKRFLMMLLRLQSSTPLQTWSTKKAAFSETCASKVAPLKSFAWPQTRPLWNDNTPASLFHCVYFVINVMYLDSIELLYALKWARRTTLGIAKIAWGQLDYYSQSTTCCSRLWQDFSARFHSQTIESAFEDLDWCFNAEENVLKIDSRLGFRSRITLR